MPDTLIPDYLREKYSDSLQQDSAIQGAESSLANLVGRAPVTRSNEAGLAQEEIEAYLQAQRAPEPKVPGLKPFHGNQVDAPTNNALMTDDAGKFYTTDPKTGDTIQSLKQKTRDSGSKGGKGGGKGGGKSSGKGGKPKLKALTSKELGELAEGKTLMGSVDALISMKDKIEPSWWKSMYNEVTSGVTGGRGVDKGYLETKAAITNMTADIRHKLSGAAVSESEREFLKGMLPEAWRGPEDFEIKMKTFKERYSRALKDYKDTLKSGKRDMSGFEAPLNTEADATADNTNIPLTKRQKLNAARAKRGIKVP